MASTASGQSSATDVFLSGNFAPVRDELDLQGLRVRGALPPELQGCLLRDGPNPIAAGQQHHWFVGDGMLHGIWLSGGQARRYRNRFIRTPAVQTLRGLAAAPRAAAALPLQGSGNVNVIQHGGRLLALSEVGLPFEVDAQLGTVGEFDFAGKLTSNMTAHPKIDPVNGELVFFGYDFGDVSLRYHVANAAGELVHSVDIPKPLPTMMHDFGVTATRVVHMDLPVVFSLDMVAAGKPMPFHWSDTYQARLGIMPRRGGAHDVIWIDIDPCYVFHPLNAYDDGDAIVMDVARHERTFVEGEVALDSRRLELVRWTIDPVRRRVTSEVLDPQGQEFPRVSPRVECHRHRFGYSVSVSEDPHRGFDGLIKHDLQRGLRQEHRFTDGRAPGEGIFVPVGAGEDEGYVLSVVYNPDTDLSELHVLDATRFSASAVAIVELGARVPFGFHGNWVNL